MAFIVICGVISVLCFAFYFWSSKQQKKENAFKDENSSRIRSLDIEYNQLCDKLLEKEQKICSDSIVVDEINATGINSHYNVPSTKLKFSKNSNGELVWYEYRPVRKYIITDRKSFKAIPNLPGHILIKDRYPINQIMFFREVGSVQYTTSVNGGGVNLAGAVVGGMVAGAAGAVIGSRQAVTSSTKTHDDRKVVLKLNDGREKVYDYKYYEYFIKLIPEKEYSFVMAKSQGI